MNRGILIILFVLLSSVATDAADIRHARARCPNCRDKFKHVIVLKEWVSGFRLDLKQFGNPHSPSPLAECPKCGIIAPDGGRDEMSREEVERLREIAKSDRFLGARDETSYFRLAVILESLGRSPDEIAFTYLKASWQVDDDPMRCQIYMVRSLRWYELFLEHRRGSRQAIARAMLLRVELLRRLERFEEAKEYVDELRYEPLLVSGNDRRVIGQQADLIALRSCEPHMALGSDARVEVVAVHITEEGLRHLQPRLAEDSRLPSYPIGPYASGVSGSVTLQLSVTRSGYVIDWQVKSSTTREFSNSVLRGVRDWTFDPARLDGAPSPVRMECTVLFVLDG